MASSTGAVLAIDQGTGSTKALVLDASGAVVRSSSHPVARSYPRLGWVEQAPEEIWASVQAATEACLSGGIDASIAAVGLSTQRESLLVWERRTGTPLSPLISWQDQRNGPICVELISGGHDGVFRTVTGLPLDPMFSSTRAMWLLDDVDPDRERSRRGELCLGTVDSWLLRLLTGQDLIEVGNASRMQLLDLRTLHWSPSLLELCRIPEAALPEVVPSVPAHLTIREGLLPNLMGDTSVGAVLGDSHAALFAHAGWRSGVVKATYGTGSSVMAVTNLTSEHDGAICQTIAWQDDVGVAYAAEGNIRSSGATLTWVAELLDKDATEVASMAAQASSQGLHLVPAFNGLAAPWWDAGAVGLLAGLRFETGRAQLARAALESIAFQVEDVVASLEGSVGPVHTLLADGGASSNDVLMQLQADTSGRQVHRSRLDELSALGAGHLAGVAGGLWSRAELDTFARPSTQFDPVEASASRRQRGAAWRTAVRRARSTYHRFDEKPSDRESPDRPHSCGASVHAPEEAADGQQRRGAATAAPTTRGAERC